MPEYKIDISQVEEWQMIKNLAELESLFTKAKSTIVQGEKVLLVRNNADGNSHITDEISTEEDLKTYKKRVFKYLK